MEEARVCCFGWHGVMLEHHMATGRSPQEVERGTNWRGTLEIVEILHYPLSLRDDRQVRREGRDRACAWKTVSVGMLPSHRSAGCWATRARIRWGKGLDTASIQSPRTRNST